MQGAFLFAAESGDLETVFGPLNFAIAGSLLFWGLVCFLIYYFVLAPRMMSRAEEIIEDRNSTIKEDLAAAEAANAEAANVLAQYEADLDTARSTASAEVREVLADAEKKAIAAENRISKKIAKQAADADEAMRTALSQAQDDLADSAATTAQSVVARLAGLKVTKAVAKSAVKASA